MNAKDAGRPPRLDPAPEPKPTLQQLLDNSTTVRVLKWTEEQVQR